MLITHGRMSTKKDTLMQVFYGQDVDHCGLEKEEKEFLKYKTFYGNEIVAGACRLAPGESLVKPTNNIDIRHTLS